MSKLQKDILSNLKTMVKDTFDLERNRELEGLYANCLNPSVKNDERLQKLKLYKKAEAIAMTVVEKVIMKTV